ncbi:MAG: tRNA pseudouridine(38-40) synthase TruA [Culicoidibacterales bacterium]
MMRVKCTVTYNGAHFFGFQKQPNLKTVQGELERALNHIHRKIRTKIFVSGSGRTDAGVHAVGQVIHFDTPFNMDGESWKRSMNGLLPPALRVIDAMPVRDEFHARYSATAKTYHYYFHVGETNKAVFDYDTIAYLPWDDLNLHKMATIIKEFQGEHDFSAFCRVDNDRNPNKEIFQAEMMQIDTHRYCIIFHGTGFLRYQVRTMVGTLIDFARNRQKCDTITEILESKDRNKAGLTAPPEGLYLMSVEYGEDDEHWKL